MCCLSLTMQKLVTQKRIRNDCESSATTVSLSESLTLSFGSRAQSAFPLATARAAEAALSSWGNRARRMIGRSGGTASSLGITALRGNAYSNT